MSLSEMLPSLMMAAGLALLIWFLMRRYLRYYGRRKVGHIDPPLVKTSRGKRRDSRALYDAPPDVLRWEVEMQEMTRELKAELDTKIRIVQQLVLQARREAEHLEQVLQQAKRLGLDVDDRRMTRLLEAVRQGGEPPEVDGAGFDSPEQLQRFSALMSESTRGKIHDLADRHVTTEEIAEQLGYPLGDVEMILGLRQQI